MDLKKEKEIGMDNLWQRKVINLKHLREKFSNGVDSFSGGGREGWKGARRGGGGGWRVVMASAMGFYIMVLSAAVIIIVKSPSS